MAGLPHRVSAGTRDALGNLINQIEDAQFKMQSWGTRPQTWQCQVPGSHTGRVNKVWRETAARKTYPRDLEIEKGSMQREKYPRKGSQLPCAQSSCPEQGRISKALPRHLISETCKHHSGQNTVSISGLTSPSFLTADPLQCPSCW